MWAICVRDVGGVYPLWLKGFILFVCSMWHSAPNGGVVVAPPLVFPFCSFLKPWGTFEKVPQTPQNFQYTRRWARQKNAVAFSTRH